MLVTQKCQYALRAVFALARRGAERPSKIAAIAEEQAIPTRFLEAILNQLKQAGFVESRRGVDGGYWLARRPERITVGEIARAIDGPIHADGEDRPGRRVQNRDVFEGVWREASDAVYEVFDGITLAELMERQAALDNGFAANYTI
jgi:Rrf2 family transcriptional regulator, cysteine metabolism repressor